MKKKIFKLVSIVLLLVLALSACGPAGLPEDTEAVGDNTESIDDASEVVTSEEVIDTNSEETTNMTTPNKKEIKNILMIGNSFCYYFTQELYNIALADGYELNVANLYKSGCSVQEHWTWLNNNSSSYTFHMVNKKYKGNFKQLKETTIQGALDYAKKELGGDWDVITLQQHFGPNRATDYTFGYNETFSYAKKLFDRISEEHPDSLMLWHQTWAYEVGYAVAEKYVDPSKTPGGIAIDSVEVQTLSYENIKKVSQEVAKENGVNIIPSGDAWQLARADARVGDTMCKRLGTNGDLGDYYHDGDVGGGQYLNACVWYEVLMGKSCIGNTWRPDYDLSEEKIVALQEAAHAAVAAVYGEDYAK